MVFVKQKILQKERLEVNEVNEYEMTERKIYKNFDHLSKKELNTKNN